MKDIMDLIKNINQTMNEYGFNQEICLKNDNITITESEVIMKLPFTLTVTLPRSDFEGQSSECISHAISQAVSRTVSRNK